MASSQQLVINVVGGNKGNINVRPPTKIAQIGKQIGQQVGIGLPNVPMQNIPLLAQPENAVTITKKERDEILSDTAKKEAQLPLFTIVKSAISLYSWDEMQRIAGPIRITNLNLTGNGSVNDPRMGVVSLNSPCQYCSQIDCPGHFGLIEFKRPIYNPTTIRETVSILTCVCNDCSGLLITEDLMRQQGLLRLNHDKRLAAMEAYCKDHECLRRKPQIGEGILIPCAKNPIFVTTDIKEKGEITYKVPEKGTKKPTKEDQARPMPIETVISILDRISIKDAYLLGFPTYHRQYSSDVILKMLDRVPDDKLILAGLKFYAHPRKRLYRDLLTSLTALSPQILAGIGFGNQNIREIPENIVLAALDRLSDEQLTTYDLKRLSSHRQIRYDELLSILDSLPEDLLRELKFLPGGHPRNVIIRGILVPPVIARPPVYEGGLIHYDQLTHMYVTIMRKVISISNGKGAVTDLYTAVKQLIFKTEGKKMGMHDFLSIIERIQGKSALLRGLLMGKRDNYCGRTVAGPDPSLRFGQLRVPKSWAPVLTKKIPVTNFNINYLTGLLEEGKITHITTKKTGLRKFYSTEHKYKLQIGDRVERWLENGDRMVDNRQPTLHKQSMMSYKVVLGDFLSLGLHLSYTTPMNCDFDGDENNAWNPQDFEVEAEAEILMNVENNIMSDEQNRPIMGLVMNSVSGAYLLSDPTTRIDDDLFAELLTLVTNQNELKSLGARLSKYGVHPRSGQAIFSAMLPEDFYYNQKGILIIEGILISGRLKKSSVGPSHRSIIQELYKNYGPKRTSDFFTDAPWIINKWLIERGFSVGMLDMINLAIDEKTGEEYDKSKRVIDTELAKIYVQLEALGDKSDDPAEESFRQRQINNLVNVAQGIGLRLAKEVLSKDNSIGVMTDQGAGTKGGIANVGQMFGAVGQQNYRGERLKATLTNGTRLLPVYDVNNNNPEAHAFISTSFFTGIGPAGLFFLQAGGREGLLDTALKTADTGAMQHRMIKAFENIIIGYDGSIRNTIGTMFAPMYNSGYSIGEMMSVDSPGKSDFSSFIDLKSLASELNIKRGWVPRETNNTIVTQRTKVATEVGNKQENILPPPQPDYVKSPIVTNTTINYNVKDPVSVPDPIIKITKFEKARIIGTRATQLGNNAPPLINIGNEIDPVNIAMMEYNAGILPLYIIRKYADGSYQKVYPTLDNI